MCNDKKQGNDGSIPERVEKGYQPSGPVPTTIDNPKPQSGYIPTVSEGDNPTNAPATPPGDE